MTTQRKKPSLLRRIATGIVTLTFTSIVVAGAAAAVVFGLGTLNERATAAEPPAEAVATPVQVRAVRVEPGYDVERRFIGQIEAGQTVDLSFELTGKLVDILVDEGEAVEAGQIIARLDTDLLLADQARLRASRSASAAQLDFAESQVTRNKRLSETGFASAQRLDQSIANRDELIARIAETDAALAAVAIRLEKSNLAAPFSGRVAERVVDGGETMAAGQRVLRLVDDNATKIRVGVPLDTDIQKLHLAEIDIDGMRFEAELDNVRPDIDPVTRTRTVIYRVDDAAGLGLGRTAKVILTDYVSSAGAWVPLDAVSEGRGSLWSVLVVDPSSVVRSAAVEILHAESDRLYVRGTFEDGDQMIDAGPQRVTPGQTVRVMVGG